MATWYRLTSVETVRSERSWLFTARGPDGSETEVFLVPCENEDPESDALPVQAWVNRCTHEQQRLYRDDIGAILRKGGIVCPKHGSIFDSCSGYCDNGDAAESTLLAVDIDVEDGQVYLVDEEYSYLREGPREDDDDDGPQSTSHLRF